MHNFWFLQQIGHAVINIAKFSEALRPVGTWFIADVRTINDGLIEPIIWKVTQATIIEAPCDQWGNSVRVANLGQHNGLFHRLLNFKHITKAISNL